MVQTIHWLLAGTARIVGLALPARWRRALEREPILLVLGVLIVAAVLMRLNNAVRYSSLRGFDAFGHATYIRHVLETWTIPLPTDGWGQFHPPLYYVLAAAIWSMLRDIEPRQVLKIINVIFNVASFAIVAVGYRLARNYFPGQLWPAWVLALYLLALPVQVYTSPMLGNEGLNTLICSLAMLPLVHTVTNGSWRSAAVLGFVLGLAMLTKFTSIVIVGAAFATIALRGVVGGDTRLAARKITIASLALLAVCGWFYARNVALYGNPFQMSRDFFATQRVESTIAVGARGPAAYLTFDPIIFSDPTYVRGPVLDSVWTGAYATTWFDAHAGWFLPAPFSSLTMRRVGRLLMLLGLVPTALVLLGVGTGVRRLWRDGWDPTLASMLVTLVAMLAMFVIYTFENRIYTAVKASYLQLAIVPFGFWFVLGLDVVARWSRRAATLAGSALVAMMLVILPVFTYQLFFEVPLGSHYWNSEGVLDYWAGFPDKARPKFEASVDYGFPYMRPANFYVAHENLGTMAFDRGQYHEALVEWQRAMDLVAEQQFGRPEDIERFVATTRAEYWNLLAIVYDKLAWDQLAWDSIEKSLLSDPSIPESHYDRAALLIKRGQAAAAIPSLRTAIDLDPGFADAHVLLGVAEQRAGNCVAAIATLESAMARRKWPRRIYPHEAGTGELQNAAIRRRRHLSQMPPTMNADYALAVCRAEAGEPPSASASHEPAPSVAKAAEVRALPPYVVVVGDSLSSWMSPLWKSLKAEFPAADVVPTGFFGASTWVVADLFVDPSTWERKPDLVVVLMGANNYNYDPKSPATRGWQDFESIRVKCRNANVRVILGTPLAYPKNAEHVPCPPIRSATYARELRALILERSHEDALDFDEAIPPAEDEILKYVKDCLHPNREGTDRMAALVRRRVCEEKPGPESPRLCAR